MLGACGQERAEPRPLSGETLGKSSQELRAESYDYVGSSTMGAKQLALTFDDGPGTRTSELSTYLKNENIRAVFFVNGACIEPTSLPNDSCGAPTANAKTILAQLAADGHLVANHTTTHRNITTIPTNQRVQELSETDALIVAHGKTRWNRSLFRAPFGAWASSVHTTLSASTMRHYVGPIYWDIGGYSDRYPNAAADWACFQGDLKQGSVLVHSAPGDPLPDGYATTRECGDAYRAEIDAVRSGIVLMHDPASGSTGSTVDMVKYLVPLLKADGYTFVRADEVPRIAADFPACAGTGCVTCSGAAANQCTSCAAGRYLSGGTCLACSTCAAGTYQSAACTATTDTVCPACDASCTTCSGAGTAACTSCAPDRYLAGGSCLACSTCAAGSYPSAACTATTNTVCAACDASCTTCSGAGTAACTSC
ncbi:MAG: polysaccharide deacetylase family protein, partial [Myxococcales bacterium]|nr:polysaccharide deacetylase family protein [Myxococcales bacterium]